MSARARLLTLQGIGASLSPAIGGRIAQETPIWEPLAKPTPRRNRRLSPGP